jgi:hypothetical protein
LPSKSTVAHCPSGNSSVVRRHLPVNMSEIAVDCRDCCAIVMSNEIYDACINAKELDNDGVLCELKKLTVIGPK